MTTASLLLTLRIITPPVVYFVGFALTFGFAQGLCARHKPRPETYGRYDPGWTPLQKMLLWRNLSDEAHVRSTVLLFWPLTWIAVAGVLAMNRREREGKETEHDHR